MQYLLVIALYLMSAAVAQAAVVIDLQSRNPLVQYFADGTYEAYQDYKPATDITDPKKKDPAFSTEIIGKPSVGFWTKEDGIISREPKEGDHSYLATVFFDANDGTYEGSEAPQNFTNADGSKYALGGAMFRGYYNGTIGGKLVLRRE